MIISGGKIIAIGELKLDKSLTGDGVFSALGVKNSQESLLPGQYIDSSALKEDNTISVSGLYNQELSSSDDSISISALKDENGITSGYDIRTIGGKLNTDIEVTNTVGMVFEGTTLSAGTKFEDIFSSAFTKYISPSVSLTLTPSALNFDFDVSGSFEKSFTLNTTIIPGSLPVTSVIFSGEEFPLEEPISQSGVYSIFDKDEPLVIQGPGTTNLNIKVYTESDSAVDNKNIVVNQKYPIYYGTTDLNSELIVSALTRKLNYKTTLTYNCDTGKNMYLITNKELTKAVQSDQNVTTKWVSNSGTINVIEGTQNVKYNLYTTTATDTNTFIFTLSGGS